MRFLKKDAGLCDKQCALLLVLFLFLCKYGNCLNFLKDFCGLMLFMMLFIILKAKFCRDGASRLLGYDCMEVVVVIFLSCN